MWEGFKIQCYLKGWSYSLNLFRCFLLFSTKLLPTHFFQTRFPNFKPWCWDHKRPLVTDFKFTNSNWKRQYFFFKGGVTWCLETLIMDPAPSLGELSAKDSFKYERSFQPNTLCAVSTMSVAFKQRYMLFLQIFFGDIF